MREQGILLPAGPRPALKAVPTILDEAETVLPRHLRQMLMSVHEELRAIEAWTARIERELQVLAERDPVVVRLRTIPWIGLLTATALVGTVGHIHAFRRTRGTRVGLSSPGGRAAAHTPASLDHHGARPAWPINSGGWSGRSGTRMCHSRCRTPRSPSHTSTRDAE